MKPKHVLLPCPTLLTRDSNPRCRVRSSSVGLTTLQMLLIPSTLRMLSLHSTLQLLSLPSTPLCYYYPQPADAITTLNSVMLWLPSTCRCYHYPQLRYAITTLNLQMLSLPSTLLCYHYPQHADAIASLNSADVTVTLNMHVLVSANYNWLYDFWNT